MTDAGAQDVRTLISLLREIMKEDTKILAAVTCDEAELEMGRTDLPTVRLLAHELIGVAQKALADYIDGDTIIDVKATGRITEAHVMQVLSYAYLSTKRSDLSIKRAIVYDAVSGRSVEVSIGG